MRVACLGGGPAGLYFAISMKLRDPAHEVVVFERNRPDDTFGWGVVLSDETLDNLARNDPVSAAAIRAHFAYWDDIAVHSPGHAHGLDRPRLLRHRPQEVARSCCRSGRASSASSCDSRPRSPSRGLLCARLRPRRRRRRVNSRVARRFADVFKPDIDVRKCKFVWLGTHQKFDDAFTFIFEETEHGWVWAHAYQFDDDTATFIVECAEDDLGSASASAR